MGEFTKQEIEAEHRRRRRGSGDQETARADECCIHCGRPFSVARSAAGEHGLCDDCLFDD